MDGHELYDQITTLRLLKATEFLGVMDQTVLTQHFPQPGEHSTKHSKGLPALSEVHGEADTRGVNSIPEHLEILILMNNYKYTTKWKETGNVYAR